MKRRIQYLTVAFLAVCLAAYAQQRFNGIRIGPNPSTTTVEITGAGDVVFTEKADHSSTPGAGYGYLWVENTTPSSLVFTDDAGTDTTLGSGGGFTSATITGQSQVVPVAGDFIIGTDASDGDALKKFDIDDILGAGGGITDGATLTSGLTFPLAGLHILDTNASHDLIISPGSDLAADRTLTITTGDSNRTLTLTGDASITGTNTGDVSLAGTPDYITISGQTITRGAVDLAADVTGTLPIANGGTGLTAVGTANQVLATNSGATAIEWQTLSFGNVGNTGTPADGQVAIFTDADTIEGDSALTFDTTDDTLVIAASGRLGFGAVDILTDSAGTTTLNAIDALDGTTESTIEAAIDTLANLTSIQGQSVTVAGTTSITGTNTGDVALAGTPDYITISGQTITRGAVDLAADVTGDLPLANLAQFAEGTLAGRAMGAGTGDLTALTFAQILALTSERVSAVTSTSNSVAWNSDSATYFAHTTSENTTIAAGSGTERELQTAVFVITQGATPRTLAWNAEFVAGLTFGDTIPAVGSSTGDVSIYMFKWFPSPTSKWVLWAHVEY